LLNPRQWRRGVHHHPEVQCPKRVRRCPKLSARRNIVVIADEAHRSQYGFGGKRWE